MKRRHLDWRCTHNGGNIRAVANRCLSLLIVTYGNPLQILFRAVNSAVECHLHTVEATGSIPVPPTTLLIKCDKLAGAVPHTGDAQTRNRPITPDSRWHSGQKRERNSAPQSQTLGLASLNGCHSPPHIAGTSPARFNDLARSCAQSCVNALDGVADHPKAPLEGVISREVCGRRPTGNLSTSGIRS